MISLRTRVERILEQIVEQPELYAITGFDVREALFPGFPYAIYYQIAGDEIRVVSIFHTSRDPVDGQNRLEPN